MFTDDLWMNRMGHVHFVRSPHAHALIRDVDVSRAAALEGVYATLTGEEVDAAQRPLPADRARAGGRIKDYCLAVGKARYAGEPVAAVLAETRELARDAAALVEVDYEPLDPVVDTLAAAARRRPVLHTEVGSNVGWHGSLRLRRRRVGAGERRPRGPHPAPPLPPLLLDPARVQRGAGQLGVGHRDDPDPLQQPDAAVRGALHRPGARRPRRPADLQIAGHRRRLRAEAHLLRQHHRDRPALAQGQPAGEVDRVPLRAPGRLLPRQRAHLRRHRGAGDGRRHDPRLQDQRLRRRRRLHALRAARRRDLLAGAARLLPLPAPAGRLPHGAHEQDAGRAEPRLLAAPAPLAGRADRRHRRQPARPRPGRGAASRTTSAPRSSPTRRRTAASTTPATTTRAPRPGAGAGRLRGLARAPARGRGQRGADRDRDRLDPRLRHQQLRPGADHQQRPALLGQRRGGDRQARPRRRSQRRARHRAAGPGPRDDDRAGGRRRPRPAARRRLGPARRRLGPQRLRRLLRHLREPVRGDRDRRRARRRPAPARRPAGGRRGRARVPTARSWCCTAAPSRSKATRTGR